MPRLSGLGFQRVWLPALDAIDLIAGCAISTGAGGLFFLQMLCQELPRARRAAWPAFSGSPRGQRLLVRLGRRVNAVVGMQALWQPQMEPAPAGHTTRLQGAFCWVGTTVLDA